MAKPDPRVFEPARQFLEKKKVALSQTLFIGDGIVDALAARDAGLQFVGVATGPKMTVADFEKEGFVALESVEKLLDYLGID